MCVEKQLCIMYLIWLFPHPYKCYNNDLKLYTVFDK